MSKSKGQPGFLMALSKLPKCVDFDALSMTTIDELRFAVQDELDLTEEGQDGTSRCNLKPLRNWLKRFGKP